ncbi:MAG TPA: enoyl-CoA hydratase-related protein [Azospirillum sp.]
MGDDLVSVSVDGAVAVVTLNRPKARNALNVALTDALAAALDRLEADAGVKAIVLTGAGEHFAAGADVKEMLPMTAHDVLTADFAGCCTRLAGVRTPVVAAVRGYALGGGCELVEMCDVVVAAESARFGHPEVGVGTMPGAGGTQRLPRSVGKHKAMDLLLTGRPMTAEEAERAGLVSRVVPDERLMEEALDVARRIASLSAPVVRLIKESVNHAFRGSLPDGLAFERRLFHLTFATEDRREGMAAFVEKRPPDFKDR